MPSGIPYVVGSAAGEPGLPTSMLAQGLYLTPAFTTISLSDSAGASSFALLAGWYRIFLAPPIGTADGTETKPNELLGVIEAGLVDSRWRVELLPIGRVKITYLSTGTGTITWSTGDALVVRNLLGFTANISLTSGSSITATYPPMGCLFMRAREKASDWTARAAGLSASLAGNGVVSGRTDGRRILTQQFTSRVHPRTWTEAARHGSYVTPLYSLDNAATRRLQPTGPVGLSGAWSCDEFITTALGRRLGMALGTLQDLISEARTDYEAGYLLPDPVRDTKTPKSGGNWPAFRDLELGLTLVEGYGTGGSESR